MHLAILARYSCSIARTSPLYLLLPSDMIKSLVGFFLSKRKKTNSSPYICLVCSVYIVQKIGVNKRTCFCPKSFVYIITMDKTKPNHRTIVFFFSQGIVLLLCCTSFKDNASRFYFRELMKLGCKGNYRAYIYPR